MDRDPHRNSLTASVPFRSERPRVYQVKRPTPTCMSQISTMTPPQWYPFFSTCLTFWLPRTDVADLSLLSDSLFHRQTCISSFDPNIHLLHAPRGLSIDSLLHPRNPQSIDSCSMQFQRQLTAEGVPHQASKSHAKKHQKSRASSKVTPVLNKKLGLEQEQLKEVMSL